MTRGGMRSFCWVSERYSLLITSIKTSTYASPKKPPHALALCTALLIGLSIGAIARPIDKPAAPTIPKTPAQWRDAATRDIQAGYKITVDNHPGIYDRANPNFLKNLQAARQFGLKLAAKVHDGPGYDAAIQGFNVRIHDGHAGMGTKLAPSLLPPLRWPGFVTVWRSDALFVAAAEPGGPVVGSKLLSCDGTPMKDLITKNVFTFQGRIDEPGHWWYRARQVFLDRGNPFIQLPKRCEFQVDGKANARDLTWVSISEQGKQWRDASYNGDQLAVGITEPRPKLFWVAMPTFQPDEKQRDAYHAMAREVQEQRQRYLDADAIVVDLRHNQGGSSSWSQMFAKSLWGQDRVERRLDAYSAKTEVWWRASKDNTAHMEGLVNTLTQQKQVDAIEWAKANVTGMRTALNKGQKFFVEKDDPPAPNRPDAMGDVAGDPPALTKPVYVWCRANARAPVWTRWMPSPAFPIPG